MLLGLDNAGKTTLLKSLASEDVNTITPTQVSGSFKKFPLTCRTLGHVYKRGFLGPRALPAGGGTTAGRVLVFCLKVKDDQ